MKFCFSFGTFDIKIVFICLLAGILEIYINLFIYGEVDGNKSIFDNRLLLDPLCYYVGFLLNIIPALINNKCSKTKKEKPIENKLKEENIQSIEYIYNNPYDQYLSKKDFIKFLFICFFLLLTDFIDTIISIKEIEVNKNKKNDTYDKSNCALKDEYNDIIYNYIYYSYANIKNNTNNDTNNNENGGMKTNDYKKLFDYYEDDYLFFEFIIIFILIKFFRKTKYYKHQNISFVILCFMEIIKSVIFISQRNENNYLFICFNIINSILYGFYYSYIRGLMKYKFISPYKICYMIGIINIPIISIIYIVISFFDGNCNVNKDYCLDIFESFKEIDALNYFRLISLSLSYGVLMALFNKAINDYTLYHIYIPLLVENFIKNIISYSGYDNSSIIIIFLSISFFIELFMILVFLEIIEVNFCGLDKNLKKHIELRSITETDSTFLDDEDDDNIDDDDDERMSIQKKTNIIN